MTSRPTHVKDRRLKLIQIFGGKCSDCGAIENLEFAHIQPTSLSGKGRSGWRRIIDVETYPANYTLLCKNCHFKFDQNQKIADDEANLEIDEGVFAE